MRGQVEVADFKSGQIAQVMPGQHATVFAHGKPGLSLSGSGTFNPIEQGKPRPSSIDRIMVPKIGLSAPRNAANGQLIHALGHLAAGNTAAPCNATRISASLGEVRLNFQKVTHGLAHGSASTPGSAKHTARTRIRSGARAKPRRPAWASETAIPAIPAPAASAVAGTGAATNSGSGSGGNRDHRQLRSMPEMATVTAMATPTESAPTATATPTPTAMPTPTATATATAMVTATPMPTATTRNSGNRQRRFEGNRRRCRKN